MNSKPFLPAALIVFLPCVVFSQAQLEITAPAALVLNHDPVEVELEDLKTITIRNANMGGGAPLDGSLSFVNFTGNPADACPSCAYWSFVGVSTFSLAANASAVFTIKFKPDVAASPGNHSIKVRITATNSSGHPYTDVYDAAGSADDNFLDVDILTNAEAKKTTINYSLVLDRSGSMSITECGRSRIDLLAESAALFFDLTKLRKQDLPNFDGDSIGMVKFDDIVNADYLPRNAVTDAFIAQAKELLSPLPPFDATTTESKIQPRGLTAIGPAVIDAINIQLPEISLPNTKKVIVLFSDGYENVAPFTNEAPVLDLLADRQDINIYTIGMGSSDHAALQALSLNSGLLTAQHYGFPSYATTCDPYSLANFYLKVYHSALGSSTVIDPTYYVSLSDTTTRTITSAWITSSDKKATFVVFDPPSARAGYSLDMVSPKGESIEALSAGLAIKKIADFNYTIYEVNFAAATDPTSYVGRWDLKISPKGSSTHSNERSAVVPIGFSAATFSNIKLGLNSAVAGNEPGNELVVAVDLLESGLPVSNVLTSKAIITTPAGKQIELNLLKDGFNKYIAKYPHTYESGTYKILVSSTLKNAKGEFTTREETKYVVVENERLRTSPIQKCLSCWWTYVFAVLIIALLIWILIKRR
jgi:hypothetical protein